MDRFVSGQETNKFEVPLPSTIGDDINSIQVACKQEVDELRHQIDNRFDYVERNTDENFQRVEARITPLNIWHERFGSSVAFHDNQFNNLITLAVRNPIIRFLNFYVFHWFTINIAENRYPLFGQHEKYIAYIGFMNPEQFIDDYGYDRHKDEMRNAFKSQHKLLKSHLKKIKSEGYDLSNIRFRF